MAHSKICWLTDWGLSPSAFRRLGERPVNVEIQQKGPRMRPLFRLPPAERQSRLAASLTRGLHALEKHCPQSEFNVRRNDGLAWTIDARLPAKDVESLSQLPNVERVFVRRIQGLRRRRRSRVERQWYAVYGRVAVQVEGQVRGYQTIEDRVVLVKATSEHDAKRRLAHKWDAYAEPYLNAEGYMVRWKLEEVVDVYDLSDKVIDEAGTEVYSGLYQRRIRPEYEWHPRTRAQANV